MVGESTCGFVAFATSTVIGRLVQDTLMKLSIGVRLRQPSALPLGESFARHASWPPDPGQSRCGPVRPAGGWNGCSMEHDRSNDVEASGR